MSNFNWCHGPQCHKKHTQDRVRGVKGSKVLRTRKIKTSNWNRGNWYNYFCGNRCYDEYVNKHIQEVLSIAPRTEALETPVNVSKETVDHPYWGKQTNTEIKVDETRSTDIG